MNHSQFTNPENNLFQKRCPLFKSDPSSIVIRCQGFPGVILFTHLSSTWLGKVEVGKPRVWFSIKQFQIYYELVQWLAKDLPSATSLSMRPAWFAAFSNVHILRGQVAFCILALSSFHSDLFTGSIFCRMPKDEWLHYSIQETVGSIPHSRQTVLYSFIIICHHKLFLMFLHWLSPLF